MLANILYYLFVMTKYKNLSKSFGSLIRRTRLDKGIGQRELSKKIGIAGMRVIERMMGLILMVIAVQFIINGLETIINRL